MKLNHIPEQAETRILLTVQGTVQGVGFRPFVYRLAMECGLSGTVRNIGSGVEIDIQGVEVQDFIGRLHAELPPLARITRCSGSRLPPADRRGFAILTTAASTASGALIPADVAVCDACLAEMDDPADRRHGYAFINCTNCGPRYTITRTLPYDRVQTTMDAFPMCPECLREYNDPASRRFHAQPNACPACGPRLWYADTSGDDRAAPVDRALALLRRGGILALRSLGGYHLAVDARNDEAVRLLRQRKRREEKPFAVMVRDVATARRICHVDRDEEASLTSPQRPIVLLRARDHAGLAPSIAPDSADFGLMLPSAPLHHLLLRLGPDALVMTSGNVSDDPICIGVDEARARLGRLADGFLHHDRDILQRCDDSIVRHLAGSARVLRRARGMVPDPIDLRDDGPDVLAVGGELKCTLCLVTGRTAIVSQHIGDLEDYDAAEFHEATARHLVTIARSTPRIIAHDTHPNSIAAFLGQRLPERLGLGTVRFIGVQHHHAHHVACLAEHAVEGPALGVILDGAGHGPDGTVWGGEFLVGDVGSVRRAGCFRPVGMPGGDRAAREPVRMALAHLLDALGSDAPPVIDRLLADVEPDLATNARAALALLAGAPITSSCGRLVDAVASLTRICHRSAYEAQAAMRLERAATAAGDGAPYPIDCTHNEAEEGFRIDTRPIIRAVVDDVHAGVDAGVVAARFHATLIAACAEGVRRMWLESDVTTVVLSGGVFQNTILLDGLTASLESRGFTVLSPTRLPANDGGISLGQALIARHRASHADVPPSHDTCPPSIT